MPLPINLQGEQSQPNDPIRQIVQGALANPIALDSAPTTAGGQLQEAQIGYYGTNLYISLGGTTYRIAMVSV